MFSEDRIELCPQHGWAGLGWACSGPVTRVEGQSTGFGSCMAHVETQD